MRLGQGRGRGDECCDGTGGGGGRRGWHAWLVVCGRVVFEVAKLCRWINVLGFVMS
jgi:hypothetical protein